MYELTIGDLVRSPKYKNQYICEIELMEGDMDGSQTIEIEVTKDTVNTFEKLMRKIAKTSNEDYEELKGFNSFFGNSALTPWPYQCEGEFPWDYERHNYFWYDALGVKFHSKLTTN